MLDARLIVLKFGGSVLRDETTLRLAVHEVYRWRRTGHRVIAVVSALAGQTDALLRQARNICDCPDSAAVAALLANGELHSAALLGLHLDRAGVPTRVLTPSAIRLIATGPALDADPVSVDARALLHALARCGVVVVPGFVAQDSSGRTVVLGRGGSDLTALFLAHALNAHRCRLVKDVDGLYESDPSAPGATPARFARARWDDALATDGSIIQHKAVAFARSRRLSFELGGFNSVAPTRISVGPAQFGPPERPTCLRLALLGFGTVGGGVFELLREMPERFEVISIAVRECSKPRAPAAPEPLLTNDVIAAATCGADVVVEAIGGVEPARTAIEHALRAGSHVVTANKALLAEHGPRLVELAASRGRRMRYSAAVGGSTPVLERVARISRRGIRSVRALLNGTTNFVLSQVAFGALFDDAVRLAQDRGFAERDPRRDLSGRDAADKLCLIARTAGVHGLPGHEVACDDLTEANVRAARHEAGTDRVLRHVATLEIDGGGPRASVRLSALEADDPLASVAAEQNAAIIELVDGSHEILRGRGAGRWPTAESVVADLLGLSRRSAAGRRTPPLRRPSRSPGRRGDSPGEPDARVLHTGSRAAWRSP